jgi:hypothetical protein
MLNHFSVSNMQAISNDPNDIGNSYQIAIVQSDADGSNKTNVYKIRNTEDISAKIDELASLLLSYSPLADTLELAKHKKLNDINNEWLILERAGWDSNQGFHLGITSSDVALLVGVYTLAKEASVLGLPIPAIIAIDNSSIQFATFAEMTTLLLRYGAARAEMSSTFALKRKAVEAATTIEEINAIS